MARIGEADAKIKDESEYKDYVDSEYLTYLSEKKQMEESQTVRDILKNETRK